VNRRHATYTNRLLDRLVLEEIAGHLMLVIAGAALFSVCWWLI
jgi:hypothetical protein